MVMLMKMCQMTKNTHKSFETNKKKNLIYLISKMRCILRYKFNFNK